MRSNRTEREQYQASVGCQATENAPASSRLNLFPFSAVVIADRLLRRGTKSLGRLTPYLSPIRGDSGRVPEL